MPGLRKIIVNAEGDYRLQCLCDIGPSRFVGAGRTFLAQENLQGLVNAHIIMYIPQAEIVPFVPEVMSKEEAALERIRQVDSKTSHLITDNGFVFTCHGQDPQNFSLTIPDQSTWNGMSIASIAGIIPYPITVSTIDDFPFLLYDQTDVLTFYGTGATTINTRLVSGRGIKNEVHRLESDPASTWEDIRDVPDNRTIDNLFPDFTP